MSPTRSGRTWSRAAPTRSSGSGSGTGSRADREILRRLDRPDPAGRPRCVLCGRNGYLHGPEFNPLSGEGLLVDGATGLRCAVVVSCAARVGENRRLAGPLHAALDDFLAASVAVWREIDRLDAEPGGYHPVRMSVDLRKAERAAWERYRDLLPESGT